MPVVVDSNTEESKRDLWRTPPPLFWLLNDTFRFHLDAAASAENALCDRYFTKEDNALSRPWYAPEEGITRVFCNPPFSRTDEFLAKGNREALRGATVVFIVRADAMETDWWTDNMRGARAERFRFYPRHPFSVLKPRVRFLKPDGTPSDRPQFASAAIFMLPLAMRMHYREKGQQFASWWFWKDEAEAKGYL